MASSVLGKSFDAVSSHWRNLLVKFDLGSVFLTPAWQQAWWDVFNDDDMELCLTLLGPTDWPVGLAPMVRRGSIVSFLGDPDVVDYHDFVLSAPGEISSYELLAKTLLADSWTTLDLSSIKEGSPTLEHLPEILERAGCDVVVCQEDVSPGMELPDTWDEYLARLSKKDRHELRRKLRRLEASGSFKLTRSEAVNTSDDLSLFLELMRENPDKEMFLDPKREAFFWRCVAEMKNEGYLSLFFLEYNGEPVSGVLCFDYGRRRLLYNSGYKNAYGHLSVGLLTKVLCLRQAIEERLIYFDFLRGGEPYKYHLGASDVKLYRLIAKR